METLELPVLEETEETSQPPEPDYDQAAFRLWRGASRPDSSADDDSPVPEC